MINRNPNIKIRLRDSIKNAFPSALRTAWWVVKLTVCVSLAVTILDYLGVVKWFSHIATPIFTHIGLTGESALAYITGYFVNIYSAIAVITTLDLSFRAITIIAVMCLCSHNMIIETAVQKKTGSSAVRMFILRTVAAFVAAFILNLVLPESQAVNKNIGQIATNSNIIEILQAWGISTVKLVIRMVVLIILLTIMQRVLNELGIVNILSKILSPVLRILGLPVKTSFLWIVANTLGLAYGAAVMIEETSQGKINKIEADLLNHHIAISHSSLEDVLLFAAIGASFWWMITIRLALAFISVWIRRIELHCKHQYALRI
ncbi:MAG: nucleoside recognition protein [Prevotellaceae bacterium]|nr:nucleoside recognition protein [Prevotellaceae bacterium]